MFSPDHGNLNSAASRRAARTLRTLDPILQHREDIPPPMLSTASSRAMEADDEPRPAFVERITRGGRKLIYKLTVLQQPERARACGSGSKCKSCPSWTVVRSVSSLLTNMRSRQ